MTSARASATPRFRAIALPLPGSRPLVWIALLALGLRLWALTYHSLWFDEVMSTFWAGRPAGEILRVGLSLAEDKHPPLYYLMLHGWTRVFGPGDFAVRSLGAVLGALAVLPAYGIGRLVGGHRAAAVGALLVALNPFLVWYSQEARMFMPATTFALVGLYGLLRMWDPAPTATSASLSSPFALTWGVLSCRVLRRLRDFVVRGFPIILAILGFVAALYTYLFSAFLLPVAGLWLLLLAWTGRRLPGTAARFWSGAASLALAGLIFLPLARAAWAVSGGEAEPGRIFAGMAPALWRLLQVYTLGWPLWPTPAQAIVAVAAALLAATGIFIPARTLRATYQNAPQRPPSTINYQPSRYRSAIGHLLLFAWLAVPLLLGGLLLARDRTVFAETRYFIFLVPALCLCWGRAVGGLWSWRRPAGAAALALLLAANLAALPALWAPENRREAWREAAAFVAAHAGPHDAVLVQADYVHPAFERYFAGPQPVYFPFTERLADPAQIEAPLAGLADYTAVWLVQSHHEDLDPGNLVAGWFAARYPMITEVFPPGIAVRGFAVRYRTPAPALETGDAVEGLQLIDCSYTPARLAARDELLHPPSGWIHVTTHWTGAELSEDIVPSVRLVDGAGQVWGEALDRANNTFRIWPVSRWLAGEVVRADYDVNLNPITPPGAYRLVVETPATGTVVCGEVIITR